MTFELFSTSFCGACAQTRASLDRVAGLVPAVRVAETDVAADPDRAEAAGIDATPTVIVRSATGEQVFRASGVPTVDQLLQAAVLAMDGAATR
nr:thioredoxin family protein [Microbacterium indicum]